MKTAIITGGSSGIGLEFAKKLAAQKFDLVLAAKDRAGLENAAIELTKKFAVKVEIFAGDLADANFAQKVAEKIRDTKNLEILVNCAGFLLHEKSSDFSPESLEKQRLAFRVMAENVLEFSAAAAQNMTKNIMQNFAKKSDENDENNENSQKNSQKNSENISQKSRENFTKKSKNRENSKKFRGKIINIASTSAFTFQGNYSAIKRWVVGFTEGLALELRDQNISATAVCPAWMHTNFHSVAGAKEPSVPEFLFVKPELVAKIGLKDAEKGKILSIPSAKWKIIIWILQHGPRFLPRMISRKYMKTKNYSEK